MVVDPPVAVVTIDEHGLIVELDREAETILGVTVPEAAVGRPLANLIWPRMLEEDHSIHTRRVPAAEAARRFSRVRVELTLRRASGPDPAAEEGPADDEAALETLLERAERIAQIGSWDWHLATDRLQWSDNLYRIFGIEPGEVEVTFEFLYEHAHPADQKRLQRALSSARRQGRLLPLEYRIVRAGGVVRHLRVTPAIAAETEGRPRRIVGSVQDITDQRRAEGMIAAHLGVAKALTEWRTLEQGATGLLSSLASALDCAAGVLWLPDEDVLGAHVVWRSPSMDVPGLESVIRQLRLPRGVGLTGQVWAAGEPRYLLDLQEDPRFPAEAVAGLAGAVALPATHAGEVLAVVELFLCESVTLDGGDRLLRSLTSIGHELGEFLAHRRGELGPSTLTPREREVLQLAAQGHSGKEIAEKLVVSPATVRTHFEHIYGKYGVSDRAAAVAKALREGLID